MNFRQIVAIFKGPGNMAITDSRICCGYGNAGIDTRGFDCLIIPAARDTKGNAVNAAEFCGASRYEFITNKRNSRIF